MINVYNRPNQVSPSRGAEKAFKKWLFYLIFIGIAGTLIYWLTVSGGKEFEIKLISKKGNVEYRENDKDGWKEIPSVPFLISPSFEVRTSENAEAALSIADGGEVRMGDFARLVLISNQGKIGFVQTDGSCHYQVAKNSARKEYKVSFGDGDVYAEGTAFELKIKENETDIFALESNLRLAYKDKSTAMLKVTEKLIITPVGKITKAIEEVDLKEAFTLQNLKQDQEKKLVIDKSLLDKAGVAENQVSQDSSVVSSDENSNNNSTEESSNESNQNSNQESDISFKSEEVSQNSNNNNSNQATQSTVLTENQNQNSAPESQPETTATTQQTQSKSGSTTRSKCESSGGHWNSGNSVCTCSATRFFSGGKCISSGSSTEATSNAGIADTVVLRANVSGKSSDFSWVTNGGKTPYGYKIINTTDGSSKKASKKSSSWSNLKSGQTYKFQVCVLNSSGGCASYSNTRSVKIP